MTKRKGRGTAPIHHLPFTIQNFIFLVACHSAEILFVISCDVVFCHSEGIFFKRCNQQNSLCHSEGILLDFATHPVVCHSVGILFVYATTSQDQTRFFQNDMLGLLGYAYSSFITHRLSLSFRRNLVCILPPFF